MPEAFRLRMSSYISNLFIFVQSTAHIKLALPIVFFVKYVFYHGPFVFRFLTYTYST